jgi:predicted nucleic acid-binding protein
VAFDDLLAGTAVFVDANCLLYAATADPQYGPACQRLLRRVENQEFTAVTSAHVMAEMAHRLMTIEAAALFNRPLAGMANWLRRHPAEVQQLARHREALDGPERDPGHDLTGDRLARLSRRRPGTS